MTHPIVPTRRAPFGLARLAGLALAVAVGMSASWLVLSPSAFANDIASAAPPAMALRMHLGGHHEQMHAHARQVLEDAGATAEQQRRIKGLVDKAMLDQHADFEAYHASLRDLKTLLTAPAVDVRAVAAARAEQDELLLSTNRRLVDTATAIAQELTPAQRQKVGAEIDRMFAAHLGHHSP
jgi:Spy/CpxP family protein refolding chaperone